MKRKNEFGVWVRLGRDRKYSKKLTRGRRYKRTIGAFGR
jgi:hypothetical protein